jgi:hypothetical protein
MRYPYLRLPVDPDAGFPQAVRIALGPATYLMTYNVCVTDDDLLTSDEPVTLPRPDAFLVLEVAREGAAEPRVIFRRKLVPDLEYEADELAMVFTEMAVHPRNLNGIGAHGSVVRGGVALRWVS